MRYPKKKSTWIFQTGMPREVNSYSVVLVEDVMAYMRIIGLVLVYEMCLIGR